MVDYSFSDSSEATLFVFNSDVDHVNKDESYDWGANFEFLSADESVRVGASYISDLAESEENFLEDIKSYSKQVPAWSAYALVGFDSFEVTIETVQALEAFTELDDNKNKPSSTNFEIAYFPTPTLQLALRLANSDELVDAPEIQYGLSMTWRTKSRYIFSLDYLYGEFKDGFVTNDDDQSLHEQKQIAARLTIEL